METTHNCKQKKFSHQALAMACLAAVFGLAGCQKEGSAEKAGEKIDRAAENAQQQIEQTKDQAERKIEAAKESATDTTQTAGEYVDDSAITTKVKAAILNDPLLSASNIEVVTNKGIVTLRGTVNAESNIVRAKEVAGSQKDVKSVQNELIVKKDK